MNPQNRQADPFAELTLIPEMFARYSDPGDEITDPEAHGRVVARYLLDRYFAPSPHQKARVGRVEIGGEFDRLARCAALESIGVDPSQVLNNGLQLEMIGDGKAWLRWNNRRVLSANELAAFLKALRDYRQESANQRDRRLSREITADLKKHAGQE